MLRVVAALLTLAMALPAWAGAAEDKALLDSAFELNTTAIRAALARKANPNVYDGNTLAGTPLSIAALGGLEEKSKLIQAGLSWDQAVKILNGKAIEIARILVDSGAKLGVHDKEILYFPISDGNAALVALLIDKGASATARLSGGVGRDDKITETERGDRAVNMGADGTEDGVWLRSADALATIWYIVGSRFRVRLGPTAPKFEEANAVHAILRPQLSWNGSM
jgi:hypothetical protein